MSALRRLDELTICEAYMNGNLDVRPRPRADEFGR
jgi:hypothetical protein